MRLSKVVSAAMIVGALGFGALGPGAGRRVRRPPGASTAEAARQFLPALVRRRQRPRQRQRATAGSSSGW